MLEPSDVAYKAPKSCPTGVEAISQMVIVSLDIQNRNHLLAGGSIRPYKTPPCKLVYWQLKAGLRNCGEICTRSGHTRAIYRLHEVDRAKCTHLGHQLQTSMGFKTE